MLQWENILSTGKKNNKGSYLNYNELEAEGDWEYSLFRTKKVSPSMKLDLGSLNPTLSERFHLNPEDVNAVI